MLSRICFVDHRRFVVVKTRNWMERYERPIGCQRTTQKTRASLHAFNRVNVTDGLSLSLFTGTDKALSQREEGGNEKKPRLLFFALQRPHTLSTTKSTHQDWSSTSSGLNQQGSNLSYFQSSTMDILLSSSKPACASTEDKPFRFLDLPA